MKNFKLLMTFALCLAFGVSYGQIKVITTGETGIGTSTPVTQLTVEGNGISLNNPGSNKNIIGGTDNARRLTMSSNVASTGASSAFFTMFGGETHDGNGANPARAGELAIGCNNFQVSPAKQLGGFSTLKFEVKDDGNTYAYGSMTATNYITASDKKLKKNIKGLERGLNEVLQMDTKEYYYDTPVFSKATNSTKQFGVIAQELQEIVPEAVSTTKYDDYQNGIHEEYLAVDMNKITFMLVNSIQEQQVMIDALNEKIATLEASIKRNDTGSSQTVTMDAATLAQNAPNPFNQSTTINYAVPTKASNATLQIFDLNGAMLKSVNLAKGNGQVTINAGELAAGTYSYNLVVDGNIVDTKKMVLTK